MGITDEKAATRPTEEGSHSLSNSRRSGNAGSESESYGNKQKRNDRTDSKESSFFSPREADVGGMFRQLISVYREQVALKDAELERINNETERIASERLSLESKIQEFELFLDELEQQPQEAK